MPLFDVEGYLWRIKPQEWDKRQWFVGCVDGLAMEWLVLNQFATHERVSGTYVTDDLRDREDDIIWRVKINGKQVVLYILLEFQSSVDKFMAVRIMGYLALLYQDLINANKLTEQDNLPSVFPIVLYNGLAKWWAKRDMID